MKPAAGIVPFIGMKRPAVIQFDRADREIEAQADPGAGLKIPEPLPSEDRIVQLPVLGAPDVPDVAEESPADHLEDREGILDTPHHHGIAPNGFAVGLTGLDAARNRALRADLAIPEPADRVGPSQKEPLIDRDNIGVFVWLAVPA